MNSVSLEKLRAPSMVSATLEIEYATQFFYHSQENEMIVGWLSVIRLLHIDPMISGSKPSPAKLSLRLRRVTSSL